MKSSKIFSIKLVLWALLASAAVQGQTAKTAKGSQVTAATARGAIAGRVLGEDGQPLADVSVSVSALGSGRSLRRTGSTDDEGNFKINDLPAALYGITATVPGFISSSGGAQDATCRVGDNVTVRMVKGGVVTGKVTDATGQPVVGASVWALRVRDAESHSLVSATAVIPKPAMVDDRGVYRIYGLPSGSYVVYSSGAGESLATSIGARDVPTYYPSATRDTAQEVTVTAGIETQDIDIKHRGEAGFAVSGMIVGAIDNGASVVTPVQVELMRAGMLVASTSVNTRLANGFGIYGVPEGDYEILARQGVGDFVGRNQVSSSASAPQRLTVRGGDVPGVELRLAALGSIAGRVVLEKLDKTDCQITRRGKLEEVLLQSQREDVNGRRSSVAEESLVATPDEKGGFLIRDLTAGRYRFSTQLPSDYWYAKSLNLPPAQVLVVAGLALKSGEKMTGLVLTLAEGAASVSGRTEGKKLPARLRVHLVPADAQAEALHYAEVVTWDASFSFSHIAPGKYWLLARTVPEDESIEQPPNPIAWDAAARAKLRREAEAVQQPLELTACQRAKDFIVKF